MLMHPPSAHSHTHSYRNAKKAAEMNNMAAVKPFTPAEFAAIGASAHGSKVNAQKTSTSTLVNFDMPTCTV